MASPDAIAIALAPMIQRNDELRDELNDLKNKIAPTIEELRIVKGQLRDALAEKAALVSDDLLQQFKSRIANAQLGDKESLENERRFEQMFSDLQKKAILNPHLYIDSVGAVFLSGEMPFFDPPEDEF